MQNHHSLPEEQPVLTQAEILKCATALCNELDELTMLHAFYYQAVENLMGAECSVTTQQRGLSAFPLWLRQRDAEVLAAVHRLQETLRRCP